jgi:hypothetical protein
MHIVKDVAYLNDYRIKVTFGDCVEKIVDLQPYLEGEIFSPLMDKTLFAKVRIDSELDTIVWDNGADVAPDFLYEIGVEVCAQTVRT